ncbi:hypothetical protein [Candidatus Marithrix sp. Canyon 246]|uniref:hypothetical protein n=1 Tax=Candidatus Marithrix sp. Canyon 246 TaxID=1827136 RepID=UPI0009F3A7F2|nr:hypothetical protein [Candidatus Marithrix sp. Canyon 246]
MEYTIVLSDELLKAYYDFKNAKHVDPQIITNLLKYYSRHLTNIAQLKRIAIEVDNSVSKKLLRKGYINQTLEELCEQTKYKLILNTERNDYPYININADKIERNFTATYNKNESRDKTIKHIKALCRNAKYIFIYDKHMNDKVIQKISHILPQKKLNIIYKAKQLSQVQISSLKKECKDWKIQQDSKNTYHDYHDRYLLIDNNIEIILTSGFDYLFDENKDFTYIVRTRF